jgi:hypothetical protein
VVSASPLILRLIRRELSASIDWKNSGRSCILRRVKGSELLLNNFDQPLVVLATFCQQVLDSDCLLKELVREADVEWGRVQGERPHFDREGWPPDPDDPYTFESVRKALAGLVEQLGAGGG